jgi:hypothetical protein
VVTVRIAGNAGSDIRAAGTASNRGAT